MKRKFTFKKKYFVLNAIYIETHISGKRKLLKNALNKENKILNHGHSYDSDLQKHKHFSFFFFYKNKILSKNYFLFSILTYV